LLKLGLLVPNQSGDEYVMISDLYNGVERWYSEVFKVLLMSALQFKSVSRCKPRYLTGTSVSRCPSDLLVVYPRCNLRSVNVLAFVVFSVNFHLLNQLIILLIQVYRCVMAMSICNT
jgi:hypothetical protein